MSVEEKDIIANLRAIIISCKQGILISNVQSDYREAFGVNVPFRNLGYNSLKEFFEKNSVEFRVVGDKVEAVKKCNSVHISSLVNRQGKSKSFKNSRSIKSHRRPGKTEFKNIFELSPNALHKKNKHEPCRTAKEHNCYEDTIYIECSSKTLKYAQTISFNYLRRWNFKKYFLRDYGDFNFLTSTELEIQEILRQCHLLIYNFPGNQDGTENSKKFQDMTGRFEKITLRKPHELNQKIENRTRVDPNVASHNSFSAEHFCSQNITDLKSITKTIMNDKCVDPEHMNLLNMGESHKIDYLEPFKDVEDLPLGKGAQSRLLRQKFKMLQTLKSDSNRQLRSNSDGSEIFFDLDSIANPALPQQSPCNSAQQTASSHDSTNEISKQTLNTFVPFPNNVHGPIQNSSIISNVFPRQKAQSRLDNIKSYIQSNIVQGDGNNVSLNSLESSTSSNNDSNNNFYSDNSTSPKKESNLSTPQLKPNRRSGEKELPGGPVGTGLLNINENFGGFKAVDSAPWNSPPLSCKLLELKPPKSEYWEIYITNIVNSSEIWCRLIGDIYSDAYDSMMTKLELEPPERKAKNPKIGEIYGIKVSAIWYRVKLIEMISDNQGTIFYIDVGDKDIVDIADLYQPEDVYFSVAPQAIKLCLYELESFCNDEDLTTIITGNLLGNTYIAEIMMPLSQEKIYVKNGMTVRLWDTSTETDINVNQQLLNNIIKNITLPCLPSVAQIKEVLVSCVDDNGDIYIQTNKKSVQHLRSIILNKIKSREDSSAVPQTNKTIGTDILYLTKCKQNDYFCRAKIIEMQNSTMVHVMFVDYGFIEKVSILELVNLEKSSILQAIPPQAIKVKLSNVEIGITDMAKLSSMILDQNVLLKVVATSKGNVPLVELFKRSTTGSILYSVNMKINAHPEIKKDENSSRKKSVVIGLEKVLPSTLPAPDLPNIGEHFEVFIPMASSPDLFIVQPLVTRMELMQMMTELQSLCEIPELSAATLETFEIGELYAVKHPDGNWYRGCAQAVIGSYTYSVYLCDFGDCIMVTKNKLKPLPVKFKTFPYQAVRASLFGIPPQYKDWTPIDCITFYKLVVEKYFVSTVMEINRDEKNPNYVNLGLVLTDTSGDTDVYIHKILMENRNEAFTFTKSLNNG